MVNCCVPRCNSHRKNSKGRNVSFYEFPSNTEVRLRWITNIRRADWIPTDASRVCSLHLKDTDFCPFGKRKKLQSNAVPTVFDGYPEYLQHAAIKNIPRPAPKIRLATKRKHLSSEGAQISTQFSSINDCNLPVLIDSHISDMENICEFMDCTFKDFDNIATETKNTNNADKDNTPSIKVNVSRASCGNLESVQVVCRGRPLKPAKTYKMIIRKKNKRIQVLTMQLNKLKQQYQQQLICLKKFQNPDFDKFQNILDDAAAELKAKFLLDQIHNYKQKRVKYSENTISYCIVWRNKSSKGYEFARHAKLLTLPGWTTLLRYTGSLSGETGVTTLIKKCLLQEINRIPHNGKLRSVAIDEMAIQPSITYSKHLDKLIGVAENMSAEVCETSANERTSLENLVGVEDKVANRLLCFLVTGLIFSYRLPVAYFFTKGLTGDQLYALAIDVLQEVEKCGLHVL